LKIKYTKKRKYSIGFISRKKTEKTYENQRLTIAQSLVIGHYNYFFIQIGDWPSSPVWKQPL